MSIKLENVSHSYANEFTKEMVLSNINIELENGKIYCVVGPSGSGKSTLLNIIGGLLHPTEGQVFIDSEEITNFSQKQLADLRLNKVGYIFQNYNLIPFLTVKDNILLPLRIAKKNISEYKENYEALMKRLQIKDKENAYVYQLSGGQQQRVAIARCLIIRPEIILADEPTGNLDSENTKKFISLVQSILKDFNTTFVIVTHDERLCDYCNQTIRIGDRSIEILKK
ncbi:ABC transporter ATP-binding protein [Lachnotalea glycerini]|uniref:ABC transporter ATP-binding protein n=1 Tax=Lachnotalea glycerini TaxID=1763509 RepID=A0A371JGX9_9FIRM|nr:ABC transporter ATP-binding protein [Lachnotalea glycerini]RDY31927.1 ABC transporter ATP-binding protein [Lachnotalea glycerini]